MTTLEITIELKKDRENIIKRLTWLFPNQSLKTSMEGLIEYCVNYDFQTGEDIATYINNYKKQENGYENLGKSNDINDLRSSIRKNTRSRWGI
jgi:hypothetical protein